MKRIFLALIFLTASRIFGGNIFAVYMAADNSMYSAYCHNLEQMRVSSGTLKNTRIHVFADTPDESYRFVVHDLRIDTLSITANVNSGDPKVISDFFSLVFSENPNDIKIAVIWDHGNGWYDFKNEKSVLFDNNPDDFVSLTDGELRLIFENIMNRISKKTDLVVFDACKMQTLETAFELEGLVSYIAGSEDSVPYLGMPYEKMLSALDSAKSPLEAGKIVCEEYYGHYDSIGSRPVISLINVNEIAKDMELIDFTDREIFSDIDSIDVSVNLENSLVCNKTYDPKFKGAKLFYPAYFQLLNELYPDYIKLKIDKEFDIVKKEFAWHKVPDEFPPLPVLNCTLVYAGNQNYIIFFNESYDFSDIAEYRVFHSSDYFKTKEIFNSIPSNAVGDVTLSTYQPYSKEHSLFAKSLLMTIELDEDVNLIEFFFRGIFSENSLIVRNNSETIYFNDRYVSSWRPVRLTAERGTVTIEFNPQRLISQDYMYIDDLSVYSFKELNISVLYDTSGIVHKVYSGENVFFVQAEDVFKNKSEIGNLFFAESQEKVESILYPSPAKDFIRLKTEYRGEYSLNIFSSSGRLCYASQGVLSESEIKVDLKPCNLKPGVYFYALTIENRIIKGKFGVVK